MAVMRLLLASLAVSSSATVVVPEGWQCSDGVRVDDWTMYCDEDWIDDQATSVEECWTAVQAQFPDAEGVLFMTISVCRALTNFKALSPTKKLAAQYADYQGVAGVCIPVPATASSTTIIIVCAAVAAGLLTIGILSVAYFKCHKCRARKGAVPEAGSQAAPRAEAMGAESAAEAPVARPEAGSQTVPAAEVVGVESTEEGGAAAAPEGESGVAQAAEIVRVESTEAPGQTSTWCCQCV